MFEKKEGGLTEEQEAEKEEERKKKIAELAQRFPLCHANRCSECSNIFC